jgi:Domain of unknown function (DUF222)
MGTAGGTGPGSLGRTLGVLQDVMRELAAADYAEMPPASLGAVLLALECADAAGTVARGRALNVFDAKDGHEDDGQRTAGAWLVNVSGITRAEAAGHRSWGKLVAEHPLIAQAMGERLENGAPVMAKSRAKKLCALTGKVPGSHREEADKILVTAAWAGASLRELVFLAAEIVARTAPADADEERLTNRTLRLETTLDGAGVLTGQLSPECAAAVQAVLGALSKRCGTDDDRTQGERLHDGLHEAMRRLLGSELAPKKNGHPVQAIVHIGLADLLALPGASPLQQEWTARLAGQWAGYRAATAETGGGDGAAWITGPAAKGIACDAALFPIVTGDADLDALDSLIKLCVELDACRNGHDAASGRGEDAPAAAMADSAAASNDAAADVDDSGLDDTGLDDTDLDDADLDDTGLDDSDLDDTGLDDTDLDDTGLDECAGRRDDARPEENADRGAAAGQAVERGARAARAEELVREIIGRAAALLSGHAGLASFLRRNLLGGMGLGGPSLPLDVGDVDDIPWWIRRAVHTRDQKCRWPGECDQPVAATEPHHVRHRADHGATAVENLYDLCYYHHHVLVHQKGWTIITRPDGTLEARSPDGRVYTQHTRPPPSRPG